VGFLFWIAGDVAWAQGTYESRAMGSAVISVTDLFQHRDFRPSRRPPSVLDPGYVAWFASLSDVNARLHATRGGVVMSKYDSRQGRDRSRAIGRDGPS
jgi:hypothetical protein